MKTLDHHIRSQLQGTFREIGMKTQVCSMRLVYDQWDSVCMTDTCYAPDIRHCSIVSR